MLSKCASPSCSTPFRYLHEGKLYLIGRKPASGGRTPPADFKYSGNSRALEYVWLCSSCCRDLRTYPEANLLASRDRRTRR